MNAKISEIFQSIQGEGVYVGAPQVFVRFSGCDLKCAYCDTVTEVYDEMHIDEVFEEIRSFSHYRHSVVLTGGEPLLQAACVSALSRLLKEAGEKVFLETNGVLYKELSLVIDDLDIVAMDIKIPSAARIPAMWESHKQFLTRACEKEVFVKVIISDKTEDAEIEEAVRIVAGIRRDIPFIVQPVWGKGALSVERLLEIADLAAEKLSYVRIIGQQHKSMLVP